MVAQKYINSQLPRLKKPKILLVYNTIMWYTKPFFMRLSEIYNIKFIFTNMQLGKRIYGVKILEGNEGFGEMKYKVLKDYGNIRYFGTAFGLLNDLLTGHYDILVASLGSIDMLFCFLAGKLRKKPIMFLSGSWGWKGKSSERNLGSVFTKFIVPRSEAIVVPGTKHREYFISLGASPGRVFIMPYASNIIIKEEDYEEEEKLRGELDIGTKKVILYTGRLVKRKGVEYLIEAFAKLREERDDVTLIIVGEGESRSELELLSQNLNVEDSVYFTGFVENSNLPSYYCLCDVCVVPSITYIVADIWVHVVNDAMDAGKPVIATDAVGAAFDMIKDGINGFIVPEKDSEALYKAIKKIISEPELAKRMGEESKRILEKGFTYQHMVDGFIEAIESVSKGNRINEDMLSG